MPAIIQFIITLLTKIADKIPIQGRVERWRNEIANLKRERDQLLAGACDEKKARRVAVIDARIEYLNQLLANHDKE